MDSKSLLILIPVLLVPWIVLLFVMLSANKRVLKNYSSLADKYNLAVDTSKKIGMKTHPSASGIYRNRNIKIESVVRDSIEGKKVMPHTALIVECSNTDNFNFVVVKRKRQNNSVFLAGSSLLEDNDFDNKFICRTNNPEKMKRIFDFNTRFKMEQVHKLGFGGHISLEGNHLMYIDKDLLKDSESLMRLELIMHELCDIADVMRYN
jgi:hypothetical protein